MKKLLGWLMAGALLALWAVYRLLGERQAASAARADATAQAAKADIVAAKRRLAALAAQEVASAEEVAAARAQLEATEEKLRAKFKAQGLSADDIAERFRALSRS